jgi:hypothetical protein
MCTLKFFIIFCISSVEVSNKGFWGLWNIIILIHTRASSFSNSKIHLCWSAARKYEYFSSNINYLLQLLCMQGKWPKCIDWRCPNLNFFQTSKIWFAFSFFFEFTWKLYEYHFISVHSYHWHRFPFKTTLKKWDIKHIIIVGRRPTLIMWN